MNIPSVISRRLQLGEKQVSAVISLLHEGATIPFIARYRKERTGSLDEVQIAQGEIGEERQEIEIGDVVVAHGPGQGAPSSVCLEKLAPGVQEVLIVQRLVVEDQTAQREGDRRQQQRDDPGGAAFEQARAPEQKQPEDALQAEQKVSDPIHLYSLYKKRNGSVALPTKLCFLTNLHLTTLRG